MKVEKVGDETIVRFNQHEIDELGGALCEAVSGFSYNDLFKFCENLSIELNK